MNEEELLLIPDAQLLGLIYENENYLGILYKICRAGSLSFLRSKNSVFNDEDLEDLFSEAMVVLFENIRKGTFTLTGTFQAYLNKICYYKFIDKTKVIRSVSLNENDSIDVENEEDIDFGIDTNSLDFETIDDDLFNSVVQDSEEKRNFVENAIVSLTQALESIRTAVGNCYELITLFNYEGFSIADLTQRFNYASDQVTRNQRSRCIKRLRIATQIN
ncbi:RNA polymerase sigma factor [Flavobacterium sp. TMP13]|uniref:RNA polymerase sigma factor n=1 Tax=Flavobacterium sp. TMP13 TaxID=3425950 RepID=UPI003D7856BD